MSARGIAGILVVGLGVWFLVAVFGSDPSEEVVASRTFTSSADCQDCHAEIYAEWKESQHAISWTNPAVRALSNDFANQDCIDCHAPRPVFVTGIGERVLPRTARRHEGVDCLSCHQLPDGSMAGTRADPRAACRPVEKLELTRPDFCSGCHNQHETVDQWRASKWPDRDKDCLACHMPYIDGDPNKRRDHRFPGGNVLAMVKDAVELRGRREGDGWIIELENVNAGHAFPTDERSRASDVFWRPLADRGGGPETWRHLHRMRAPYRTETDVPTTLLEAHEVRELSITGEGADGPIEVAWFYKRSPYWEDMDAPDPEREASLIHRLVLEP